MNDLNLALLSVFVDDDKRINIDIMVYVVIIVIIIIIINEFHRDASLTKTSGPLWCHNVIDAGGLRPVYK